MGMFGILGHLVADLIKNPLEDWWFPGSRTSRRLNQDIRKGVEFPFDPTKEKIIVFSDLHRGARFSEVDRFKSNMGIYRNALQYYNERGYKLVLLGDVEEGWGVGNRMRQIFTTYKDLMELEKEFLKDNRYYRIYGNHDDYWRKPGRVDKFFNQDPELKKSGIKVEIHPVIVFNDNGNKILMVHGCQGHNFRDVGDALARFIVYAKFDALKIKSAKKALERRRKMRKQELRILEWAKDKKFLVIMGHTHSIYFDSLPRTDFEEAAIQRTRNRQAEKRQAEETGDYTDDIAFQQQLKKEIEAAKEEIIGARLSKSPGVFNSGNCCVSNDEISGIEIADGQIRLVFWNKGEDTPEAIVSDELKNIFDAMNKNPAD
jgi:UDP-2,3-diacylglucosamine pyrophosphatase LpxH